MPSTYSTNLKIELMATGENSGTWGTVTNTNLGTAVEQAIVGYGNPDFTTDANLTITLSDSNSLQAARALVLNVTSTPSLSATRELIVPTIQKQYIVQNNTSGSQSITVKTSAGTGITVPNGRKAHLYVDGTNVIQMFDFVDINGGAIDGTTVGAASASTGAFTTLTASGATTLNGAVALGDAAADLITVPGTINSNVIFTDNTYDIGASGATRPRTIYAATSIFAPLMDATNLEVTNIKANDGTAAASIANSTGAITVSTLLNVDNLRLDGNTISSTDTNGNIIIAPNGTGQVQISNAALDLTTIEVTNIKAKDGTAAMSIADSTGVVSITANPVLSGGTANGVLYLNGSKVATSGSALTFDGSGVLTVGSDSVATVFNAPGDVLQFKVDSNGNTGGSPNIQWLSASSELMRLTSGGQLNLGGNFTSTNNTLQVTGNAAIGYTTAAPTTGLIVAGNVGIGTDNPITRLYVTVSAASAACAGFFNTDSANGNGVYIKAGGANSGKYALAIENAAGASLAYLESTGNLGIGTTNPGSRISVGGSANYAYFYDGSTSDLQFQAVSSVTVLGTTTPSPLAFKTSNTERARITSIGGFETRPAANGHAVFNEDSVDADFRVESDSNTHMLFVDAGSNRVGINSSSPASVFTINQPGDGDGITITHTSRPGIWKWHHSGVNSENFAFIQNNGSSDAVAYLMGRSDHYWNTDNVERLRINTSEIVANDSGANFDFRVESDNNQYMLWVDASADGVNIGGFDTIQGQLNVIKNTGDLVASTTALYITTGQTYGNAANKKNLDLVFQGYRDGVGTGNGAKARLRAIEQTADSRVGSLLIDILDSAGDLQNVFELTSSNVVVNQGGIDMDFRVESDTDTHCLFVDASTDRVGIGTNSPAYKLDVSTALTGTAAGDNTAIALNSQASGRDANIRFGDSVNATARIGYLSGALYMYTNGAERGRFSSDGTFRVKGAGTAGSTDAFQISGSAPADAARLTSSGELLVGTTSSAAGFPFTYKAAIDGGAANGLVCKNSDTASLPISSWNSATSGDNYFVGFYTEGGTGTFRGSIDYNRAGGLVRYNTTSDYRAKDIIGPLQNTGATIDALKVYEGKMKGATQARPMLIAHEAQEYAPYAVSGVKDEINTDGTPKYQQMDVSSLVPLLLAEVQSLRARVAQLEAK